MHTTDYGLPKHYLWPMKQRPKFLPSKVQSALFQALCTGFVVFLLLSDWKGLSSSAYLVFMLTL